MIGQSSRWPVWRTNPARFKVSAYWLIAIGVPAVLVVIPLLGYFTYVVADTDQGKGLNHDNFMIRLSMLLVLSPLVSWVALLVAIPASVVLMSKGIAGWGVAGGLGVIAGLVFHVLMNDGFVFGKDSPALLSASALIGIVYWLAIRLVCPSAFGISIKKDSP